VGELKWQCCRCGWVYEQNEEDSELTSNKFEELPEKYTCLKCGALKKQFKQVEPL
jgi:rubredoxin